MRETIRYWLKDYLKEEELEGVVSLIHHIAWTHSKTSFAIGLVLGSIFTGILVRWLS